MRYPGNQSSILEFKRDIPQKKQTLLKTVIGFANTYGGQIVVGVDDTGEIVGVPENQIHRVIEDLTRSIYDSISPSLFPSIFTKRIGTKLVLLIDIAEGGNKPYHFSAEKISESTYMRLGAHTMLANTDLIHQLQWQKNHKYLDEMPVLNASEDDIDIQLFEKFLQDRKQENHNLDTNEMLYHYSILVRERGRVYPSVGGILLFGKVPEKFFPESFIICTHFMGTSGRDVIATRDNVGSLIQQYRDSIAFIMSRLNRSFKISGVDKRKEELEIPPEALREIVVNAIVHRNYQLPAPTKISIYDDRIEIVSPGNFPGPILADRANIGISYIRNTIITRVFRDIGIIEKLGSGFITLFESYAKRELPNPEVIEGTGFIKCILPRPSPYRQKVEDSKTNHILSLFLSRSEINAADVMQELSISRATATRYLSQLVKTGILQKIGGGPVTRYRRLSN